MSPVGPMFTISAINVGRAAVRQAERGLSVEAPVELRVGSDDSSGRTRLFVEVISPGRPSQRIGVDDQVISACLAADGPGAAQQMVSDFVDELADRIVAEVRNLSS